MQRKVAFLFQKQLRQLREREGGGETLLKHPRIYQVHWGRGWGRQEASHVLLMAVQPKGEWLSPKTEAALGQKDGYLFLLLQMVVFPEQRDTFFLQGKSKPFPLEKPKRSAAFS